MARRIAFTPASIDGLTAGSVKDPNTPGLSIEALSSGKKVWRYVRRVSKGAALVRLRLGTYPSVSIAEARMQASTLNEMSEGGIDPRLAMKASIARASMTVDRAHQLYMVAFREGRAGHKRCMARQATIDAKLKHHRHFSPAIGSKSIHEVTENDLMKIVLDKGRTAKSMANRLAAEMIVFFKWCASLRGLEVGLESDPSRRLRDLRYPERPRSRTLSLEEIGWFLRGVADENSVHRRRAMLLLLLSATRLREVIRAHSDELKDGVWTIPADRTKNGHAHSIKLGPWGLSLLNSGSDWIIPSPRVNAPFEHGWHIVRDRVLDRMSTYAGKTIEHFTPHDLRRTARSNTKRLQVDYETAEAMLNHLKTGLERIYDNYDLEAEKAAWFLKWEYEIVRIAHSAGVSRRLGIPMGPYKFSD